MFPTRFALVLALILACLGANAQQPSQPDYLFANAIGDNAPIGRHKATRGSVRTVGPVAFNDSGEIAFLAEWPGARGIYTRAGRAVMEEGENFNGTVVVQILNAAPATIQLNNAGVVAFEATFRGKGCAAPSCTGLFLEKQVLAISAGGASGFLLTDDGRILATQSSIWFQPPQGGNPAAAGNKAAKIRSYFPGLGSIVVHPPWNPNGTPIVITPPTIGQNPQAAQPAPQGPQPAQFSSAPTPANCPVPSANGATFPALWPDGASAAGPIGSTVPQTLWGQSYRPVGQALPISNWIRKVMFAPDCRVITSVVEPIGAPGATEIWTPAGLLTRFDSTKGTYEFGNAFQAVLPPASSPLENGIRINAHCAVMVPVMLRKSSGEEPALLIGTPTKGHCAE